jgi:hypothetical protein
LAEIDYTEKYGRVTIVAVRNILSADDIAHKYGVEVWRVYNKKPYYFAIGNSNERIIYRNNSYTLFEVGSTVTQSEFSSIINHMKLAGKCLVEAVRDVKEKEKNCVQTVTI